MGRSMLITVGTTGFDDLIDIVSSSSFAKIIASQGFSKITVQYGSSLQLFNERNLRDEQINVVSFDYCSSLEPFLIESDVVIGHAGAGTILETLRKKKQLIVVVNEHLMGNHQHEIADAMAQQQYLLKSTPSTFLSVLQALPTTHFQVYPEAHPERFVQYLTRRLHFVE